MIRKTLPVSEGVGGVRFRGYAGEAAYSIFGDPSKLRLGSPPLRGSFRVEPTVALEAFRAGDGYLTLADGSELRLVMLGHTAGAGEVFVEIRV